MHLLNGSAKQLKDRLQLPAHMENTFLPQTLTHSQGLDF